LFADGLIGPIARDPRRARTGTQGCPGVLTASPGADITNRTLGVVLAGSSPMPHIVLDPGHGGTEPCGNSSPQGGRGPQGTLEKNVTLELARRIARHLGSSAALTRDGDRNLSLGERIDVARRGG